MKNHLDVVIAENVCRLRKRAGLRQVDLAKLMRDSAQWTESTVAWIETARRRVTAAELIYLSAALGAELSDFTHTTNGNSMHVELGGPAKHPQPTLAHRRAAAKLGLTPRELDEASLRLFGVSFEQERDRQARGTGDAKSGRSLQARRGHATRQILRQIQTLNNELGEESDGVALGSA